MSLRSKEKLIVVPHRPGQRAKQTLFFVLSSVAIAVVGFVAGESRLSAQNTELEAERDSLRQEVKRLSESDIRYRQEIANLERGRAIDSQAKQSVKSTIRGLEKEVSQLKADVSFYKNILAPADNTKGLQVQKLEILSTSDRKRYAYKVVLTQVANNKRYIQGVVAVNFIGSKGGKKEILPLRDISDVKELGIKFKFRYFQDIAGELILPDDFTPEKVQIVAQARGKKNTRVEQTFDWKT
ncbi:DUF6776 family protein [Alkalimarinus coralli]|uniref:DUF6776 family protein n=1 Tax=Alkalimarinus coralli TaxID=2935863 RepID=UPI00202B8F2E|nr:DUF6776 family protein [Alkalimarinus coralli]